MKKVELLVNFCQEFLFDRSLSEVNENIIYSIKDEVLTLIKLSNQEYELMFDKPLVSDEEAVRFTKLNQELVRDIQFLKESFPRQKKLRKWHFASASTSDDDEEVFDQNSSPDNYEMLKSLILKLECQAHDHLSCLESPIEFNEHTPVTQILPKYLYDGLVENYCILNKNFICPPENCDEFGSLNSQMKQIRFRLNDIQKSASFQFLRRVIRTHKKSIKTMSQIVTICLFIYGDKILNHKEALTSARDIEVFTPRRHSPNPLRYSPESVFFSKQISRVKYRRPSISSDSFYLMLPSFPPHQKVPQTNSDSTYVTRHKRRDPTQTSPHPSTPSQNKFDEEMNSVAGRCFCIIF
jgi:hypothetical protein